MTSPPVARFLLPADSHAIGQEAMARHPHRRCHWADGTTSWA